MNDRRYFRRHRGELRLVVRHCSSGGRKSKSTVAVLPKLVTEVEVPFRDRPDRMADDESFCAS